MFRITSLILAMLIAVFATAAHADSYVEDFEDTQNQQGWSYGPPQSIETSGGNPGQYLRVQGLDTFGVERAHVCGASMGGMIVQTMAIHHPERVSSM